MIAEPLIGSPLSQVLRALRQARDDLQRAWAVAGRSLTEHHLKYIEWANDSVDRLRVQVTPESVQRLVLTTGYWMLQSISDQADLQAVTMLRNTEVRTRLDVFDRAIVELTEEEKRWARPGRWIVPDTSFHINYPQKLDALEITDELKTGLHLRGDEALRFLVPILVVDELDNLKRDKVRGEAQRALAILAGLLSNPNAPSLLRAAEDPLARGGDISRGEMTVELVLDPPGHSRLPIADDELVSRAVSIQTLVGQPVYLLTYDTGQAFRAKAAGLESVLLSIKNHAGS